MLFAAITSAISLLETNVSTLIQELKISRKKSVFICVTEIILVGIVTILGYSILKNVHPLGFISSRCRNMDILDTLDFVSNQILMPVGAICTTLLVVAVIGLNKIIEEINPQNKWYRKCIYKFCMRVIVLPFLLIIILHAFNLL